MNDITKELIKFKKTIDKEIKKDPSLKNKPWIIVQVLPTQLTKAK